MLPVRHFTVSPSESATYSQVIPRNATPKKNGPQARPGYFRVNLTRDLETQFETFSDPEIPAEPNILLKLSLNSG